MGGKKTKKVEGVCALSIGTIFGGKICYVSDSTESQSLSGWF